MSELLPREQALLRTVVGDTSSVSTNRAKGADRVSCCSGLKGNIIVVVQLELIQATILQHPVFPSVRIMCLLEAMMYLNIHTGLTGLIVQWSFPLLYVFWHSVHETFHETNDTY